MTLAVWYWLFMALWLLSGIYWHWPAPAPPDARGWMPLGGSVVLFILLLILGIKVFGGPITG